MPVSPRAADFVNLQRSPLHVLLTLQIAPRTDAFHFFFDHSCALRKAILTSIANRKSLISSTKARLLAEKILAKKGIPIEYPEDALHIAIAAVNGIEVIITWNFTHLNNPFTRKKVRKIVEVIRI